MRSNSNLIHTKFLNKKKKEIQTFVSKHFLCHLSQYLTLSNMHLFVKVILVFTKKHLTPNSLSSTYLYQMHKPSSNNPLNRLLFCCPFKRFNKVPLRSELNCAVFYPLHKNLLQNHNLIKFIDDAYITKLHQQCNNI